jgi:lipid-A-disaccharide synthase
VDGTVKPLSIGFVAGESSGDQLGAALIQALRALSPQLRCYGVAGPRMRAAGCESWADAEELGVMGLTEVLKHLPRLMRLRRRLVARFRTERPQVFVGIDSPAFNLGLAAQLKAAGMRTVQYVSPQVWAWRPGRVRKIARACDLVLCLLPFETDFYRDHGVRAVFVGHPLADQIPLEVDRASARHALGLGEAGAVIAILPGSRLAEVERLGADFVSAAHWVATRRPGIQFVAPMASAKVRTVFERQIRSAGVAGIQLIEGQAQRALAAADAVLVASGTATLETLLFRRPMVAAYRFGATTAFLLRKLGMINVRFFSQPNLLAGREIVPELLQEQVSGEALGAALLTVLEDRERQEDMAREFRRVHEMLRLGGAALAAKAVLDLAQEAAA